MSWAWPTIRIPSLPTAFLSLAVAASPAGVSSAHAASGPKVISIAQARALPLGTVVTVEGSVSTPSGAFASSFFDQGFGLQDRSGGIYVSLQVNLGVAPRQQARVRGVLQESFGLLILVPASADDVKLHGRGPKVRPRQVATADVSESTEGLIVQVRGTVVEPPTSDLPFGFKFSVDDGSGEVLIFVNVETGIDLNPIVEGQCVAVTGFSSQFDTHYEIDPRSPADIEICDP